MEYFNLIAVKGKIISEGWISKKQDGSSLANFSLQVNESEEQPLVLDIMIINQELVNQIEADQSVIGKGKWVGVKGELKKIRYRYVNEIKVEYRVFVADNDQHKFVALNESTE